MDAMDDLHQLANWMRQAQAVLADHQNSTSTFLNVTALGNVGAGKSAVLNSLIGHLILPTGENGATRAPISIDLRRDESLSSKAIILQIDNKSQSVSATALRHSLQERLSKGGSGKGPDKIYLKLRTNTAPPLKLIDLPGLDQRSMDDSIVSDYAERNDAILLVIIPAAQTPQVSSSRALRIAKELDEEGTRTIGVISKIDQAASDQKSVAAVKALLLNKGPPETADIPWVAIIGQSVSIASPQCGVEKSLETAWKAETESLRSILTGAPHNKLGRIALVEALVQQIRRRMKVRLPRILSGCQCAAKARSRGNGQMNEKETMELEDGVKRLSIVKYTLDDTEAKRKLLSEKTEHVNKLVTLYTQARDSDTSNMTPEMLQAHYAFMQSLAKQIGEL